MKISEVMTRDVYVLDIEGSVRDVAELMKRKDIGSVPITEARRLVGMVTDRDIVVRAVADGKPGDTKIRDVMSVGINYCSEDDSVEDVARSMADLGVRRLPVVDAALQTVGFVSLSNIAIADDAGATEQLLSGTAQPHC